MTSKGLALVCDDEAAIRSVVGARLRAVGFDVVEAINGAEGLELAGRQRPTIVVSDLQMPELDGLSMCRSLAAAAATRDVPVVMLTARGHVLTPEDLAGTNIRRMMAKPFSAKALVQLVEELLSAEAGVRKEAA